MDDNNQTPEEPSPLPPAAPAMPVPIGVPEERPEPEALPLAALHPVFAPILDAICPPRKPPADQPVANCPLCSGPGVAYSIRWRGGEVLGVSRFCTACMVFFDGAGKWYARHPAERQSGECEARDADADAQMYDDMHGTRHGLLRGVS